MSKQPEAVDYLLIEQFWNRIAMKSGFVPSAEKTAQKFDLSGQSKRLNSGSFEGTVDIWFRFLTRWDFMVLHAISTVFTPKDPKMFDDYRLLSDETLLAYTHQTLAADFMPDSRASAYYVDCPKGLVVLLLRHNEVSELAGFPVLFTSLKGKTISE